MSDSSLHSKVCTCCLIEKPDSEFYAHKGGLRGRASQCKICCRKWNRPQSRRDSCKRWRLKNRDWVNAYQRQYRLRPYVHKRIREYAKNKYRSDAKYRQKRIESGLKSAANLDGRYVAGSFIRHTKLKTKDVPLPLIEAARALIKLKRHIWQNQKT